MNREILAESVAALANYEEKKGERKNLMQRSLLGYESESARIAFLGGLECRSKPIYKNHRINE